MKYNKVQILEFGFCWPLSVEFISETVRDWGNRLTYKQLSVKKTQRIFFFLISHILGTFYVEKW